MKLLLLVVGRTVDKHLSTLIDDYTAGLNTICRLSSSNSRIEECEITLFRTTERTRGRIALALDERR